MSTEQSIDPELIEQTKQQIRGLVNEIAQLSKQELPVEEFYGEFCSRVVSALAAIGGAIWTPGEAGGLELQYQINLRETKLAESQEQQIRHGRLLHKVYTGGEAMLVQPHSGYEGDEQAGNPTDFLLVLAALRSDDKIEGVVEVFQRPGARPTTQRGYLRFLLQMVELAGDYLKTRRLRHFSDRQALWSQLENFTRVSHASLVPREAAYTIANEGRRLIECDRVSVAIKKGRKCYIEAISGQDTFDKRSNTVTLLNQLATAVTATGDPVWYTGDTTNMAPQVEEAVQNYVDDSHSKTVAVLPLKRRTVTGEEDTEHAETLGALIVEQIENSRPAEGMYHRVDVVAEHSSLALGNALEHNRLFLMPLWRFLGKSVWVVQARTLPKTVAVLTAVGALVAALVFVPWDFELRGPGTMQPVERRDVWAEVDGTIDEVLVNEKSPVTQDETVLVQMRNTDIDVALQELIGKQITAQEQLRNILKSLTSDGERRTSRDRSQDDPLRLQGERLRLEQQLVSIAQQIELNLEKRKQLTVKAPLTGEVITWDLDQTLPPGRPVARGQKLMTVADFSKDWQLEVRMPENRMGYIQEAKKKLGELKVRYILATNPDMTFEGTVTEIERIAEVKGEEGNTVLIKVAIPNKQELLDKLKLKELRPGASVDAKVYCGKERLGFVLFHDVMNFIRSKILFRIF